MLPAIIVDTDDERPTLLIIGILHLLLRHRLHRVGIPGIRFGYSVSWHVVLCLRMGQAAHEGAAPLRVAAGGSEELAQCFLQGLDALSLGKVIHVRGWDGQLPRLGRSLVVYGVNAWHANE